MKIKEGYILRKVADRYFAVAIGDTDTNKMITVNESAKTIWDALESDTTEDKILSIMSDKYDASADILKDDIREFLEVLRREGVLEE